MKPILTWVCDQPGWAYERVSLNLAEALRDEFDSRIIFQKDSAHFKSAARQRTDCYIYHHSTLWAKLRLGPCVLKLAGYRAIEPFVTADGDTSRLGALLNGRVVVAVNQGLADLAAKYTDHARMICNGLDVERFCPNGRLGIPTEAHTRIGFVANVGRVQKALYKGLPLAECAAAFLGDGTELLRFGFDDAAGHATQRYDDMPDAYHQMDLLLHPSENEGCCSAIMEALACGVPVVCTKVGYHGEMLTHGENVLFVRRNVGDIVEAVERLWEDAALVFKLKNNGRQFAREHHDIRVVAEQWRAAIREAMGETT